ncbi:MAG TPA: Hsp20/alpha crystallin family protein [Candidatus Saccharimonadales bacterium]
MALLVRGYDPFRDLEDMASEMRKSMLQTFSKNGSNIAMPVADVFEENGVYVIHLHIVGLTEDELTIEVENGNLVVRGERVESEEDKKKRSYVLRESSTNIYRSFALPKHADAEHISAHLSDGVLRIEVPMQEEKKPRKINVSKRHSS